MFIIHFVFLSPAGFKMVVNLTRRRVVDFSLFASGTIHNKCVLRELFSFGRLASCPHADVKLFLGE